MTKDQKRKQFLIKRKIIDNPANFRPDPKHWLIAIHSRQFQSEEDLAMRAYSAGLSNVREVNEKAIE